MKCKPHERKRPDAAGVPRAAILRRATRRTSATLADHRLIDSRRPTFSRVIRRAVSHGRALRRRELEHAASRSEASREALAHFATHARTMALAGARAAIPEDRRPGRLSAVRHRGVRVGEGPHQYDRHRRSSWKSACFAVKRRQTGMPLLPSVTTSALGVYRCTTKPA